MIEIFSKKSDACRIQSVSEEISILAREVWREHYIPIVGEAQVEYMLERFQSAERISKDITEEGCIYMTAQADDREKTGGRALSGGYKRQAETVGYCAVQQQADCLFLSKIYVRKDCRKRGLARLFVENAADVAAKLGCDRIRLGVNRHNDGSIAAYRRLGFTVTSTMTTDIGEGFVMDDYLMERKIKTGMAQKRPYEHER